MVKKILILFIILLIFSGCKAIREMRCKHCRGEHGTCQSQLKSLKKGSVDYSEKENLCQKIAQRCSKCNLQGEIVKKEKIKPKVEKTPKTEKKKEIETKPKAAVKDFSPLYKILSSGKWLWNNYFAIKFNTANKECEFYHKNKFSSKSDCSLIEIEGEVFLKFKDISNKVISISAKKLVLLNTQGKTMIYENIKE